ncbi:MAG: HAD family hydrolase [Nanoarchaeota archaeon]|nr:HAD family hydrolase [Nanoarchaeota archaeon]
MKVVVLDLDGTLYKKKSVVLEMLSNFCKKRGYELSKIETEYKKAYNIIKQSKKQHPSIKDFFSEVDKIFLENIGLNANDENLKELDQLADEAKIKVLLEIEPRSHLRNFLINVKNRGLKTIVFSGSHDIHKQVELEPEKESFSEKLEFKIQQLEKLNLIDLIDEVIPTTKFGGYKPDLTIFKKLVEYLGCEPFECIMIGDSDNDMAAKDIGMKTILIGEGKGFKWHPQYVANNFEEIDAIVRSMR